MAVQTGKMERKQEAAIVALLTEPTIESAAKKIGVGETTLFRWLQTEKFQEAYREAKRQAVQQSIAKLQQASGEAVDTLRDVMANDEAPANSRVSSAKAILEMSLKAVEIEDIIKRVEELEKILKEKGGKEKCS